MTTGRAAAGLEKCPSDVRIEHGVMGLEEQREEREVLESIFPEEITGKLLPVLRTKPVRMLLC